MREALHARTELVAQWRQGVDGGPRVGAAGNAEPEAEVEALDQLTDTHINTNTHRCVADREMARRRPAALHISRLELRNIQVMHASSFQNIPAESDAYEKAISPHACLDADVYLVLEVVALHHAELTHLPRTHRKHQPAPHHMHAHTSRLRKIDIHVF